MASNMDTVGTFAMASVLAKVRILKAGLFFFHELAPKPYILCT